MSWRLGPRLPISAACAAVATTVARVYVCVLSIVSVPLWAMSLGAAARSGRRTSISALHVDAMCNRLKMLRIHARRIATQVVQIAACGRHPGGEHVGEDMRTNEFPAVPEIAVAERNLGRQPLPTRAEVRSGYRRGEVFVNFDPKPLFWSLGWSCESTCPAVVMHTKRPIGGDELRRPYLNYLGQSA